MGVDIAFGPRMNQRCGLKKYISYLKGSYLYLVTKNNKKQNSNGP